jgi:prepilin-type N-terminal cleavage/methylation domain-containing protein
VQEGGDSKMKIVRDIRGMTLVEVLTVVAILGVLLVILGFSFQGWIAKYKVEEETKRFYADLSDARARAMQKKRMTFIDLAARQYRTFEDTNTAPDGNGVYEQAADTRVASTTTSYDIVPTLNPVVPQFAFDREGLATVTGTIRLVSTLSPDYDCITIQTTRLRIGRYDGAICQEK